MHPRTTVAIGLCRPLVLPLLVFGLALAPGAAARESPVGTFLVSFTLESPCTGEEITGEGVVHFVGGEHFRYRLTAVGASGATYEVRSVDNEVSAPRDGDAAHTSTHAGTFRFVREGGGGDDDFTARGAGHTTINANGEMTADFSLGHARCS